MSNHQHTTVVLLLFIVLIRLLHTGRLTNAWSALFNGAAASTSTPPTTQPPPAGGSPDKVKPH